MADSDLPIYRNGNPFQRRMYEHLARYKQSADGACSVHRRAGRTMHIFCPSTMRAATSSAIRVFTPQVAVKHVEIEFTPNAVAGPPGFERSQDESKDEVRFGVSSRFRAESGARLGLYTHQR